MARVELRDVGLTFRVTRRGPVTLRDRLCAAFAPRLGSPIKEVHALRDVNLDCRDGDRIAIVGANGAGKSTFLKVLADIYPVTAGVRRVEGRIGSLFNVTLGFEPFATGWENIRYRCYLQGETPRTVRRKIQEIAEFSGLGESLDVPVRYYSAGMHIRLGFAVATTIEPDILLVDEVIGAGDALFRVKARNRIHNVISNASIVFAASHDLAFLRQLCNRAIWLHEGRIMTQGETNAVIREYVTFFFPPKKQDSLPPNVHRAA